MGESTGFNHLIVLDDIMVAFGQGFLAFPSCWIYGESADNVGMTQSSSDLL